MELKAYWEIIRRRAWVVVAVFVLALSASVAGFVLIPQAISYQATVRIAVRPPPEPKTGDYYTYDEYYSYLTSEYLNDDLIELIQGRDFMLELQRRLQAKHASPPGGSIQAKKAHRVMTMTVTSGTAAGAIELAETAVEALSEKGETGRAYYNQLTAKEPTISVIERPVITAGPGTRSLLDLLLRGLVGLFAGLALAFLLDYLDDTIRDSRDVETLLGVPTLGEIPGERKSLLGKGARSPARQTA